MARKYKSHELFGGVLGCDVPENFHNLRASLEKRKEQGDKGIDLPVHIPDNQEVFLDRKSGLTSIIFETLQRVGPPGSDLEADGRALTTHLEDIVAEDDLPTLRVWNTTETQFTNLDKDIPAYTLIATLIPKAKAKANANSASPAPDFTAMILTLVRLEKVQMDVVITINVPHIKGHYDEDEIDLALGKQGELIGDAVEFAARIWDSFEVRHWEALSKAE